MLLCKQKIKALESNHKGFTIIELLVSLTIFSMISFSVLQFMVVGTESYASVDAAVALQQKSQLAINNIKETVIETADAIYVDGTDLYIFGKVTSGTSGTTQSVLHHYSQNADAEIVYQRYNTTVEDRLVVVCPLGGSGCSDCNVGFHITPATITVGSKNGGEERLVDEVTSLSYATYVDGMKEHEYLKITMGLTERGHNWTTEAQVTLRNNLKEVDSFTGSGGTGTVVVMKDTPTFS